jgi:hypothetical protein
MSSIAMLRRLLLKLPKNGITWQPAHQGLALSKTRFFAAQVPLLRRLFLLGQQGANRTQNGR